MKCWGLGSSFGSSTDYGSSPSTVGDNIPYFNPGTDLPITKVRCGARGVCIILDGGRIKCVGYNYDGQTGIGVTTYVITAPTYVGDTLPFVNLGTNVTVTAIEGGYNYYCVLTTTNQVKCFGYNAEGQLGLGDKVNRGSSPTHMGDSLPFIDFGIGVEIASVLSGPFASHNCAILSAPASVAQRIKCWGHNGYYQLGYGDSNHRGDQPNEMGDSLTLVDLGTESRVKQISAGQYQKCALLVNGILKCLGSGAYGQLASGSTATISSTGDSMPSVLIDSGKTVKLLSGTDAHNCIVYDDMVTMKCFGWPLFGRLGQGDTLMRGHTPTTIIPLIPAIQLGTGSLNISSIHSGWGDNCIIFIDNSMKCFGNNLHGQLAIGTNQHVGDGPGEMGTNLTFAELFSPTKSPTLPTLSPTKLTNTPTVKPSSNPSTNPTMTSINLHPINIINNRSNGCNQ